MAKNKDSLGRTLFVVITLCLVCAIFVAGSAVGLKPLQQKNAALDMQRNVLDAAGLLTPETDVIAVFNERVETRLVDLQTLEFVDAADVGARSAVEYDPIAVAKKAGLCTKLSKDVDIASIGSLENVTKLYFIKDDQGAVETVVVYIRGYGLWGTMYGLVAVAPDMNTIKGFKFYEHSETPGLGGEIQNPSWVAKWQGKEIYDNGKVALKVTKNVTRPAHDIDALSGATLTSNGVDHTVNFWFGEHAYGPLFDKLREGELN